MKELNLETNPSTLASVHSASQGTVYHRTP